jgi:hypothetical protein
MKEIPLPMIKANQSGIVLFVVLGLATQQPWWIWPCSRSSSSA